MAVFQYAFNHTPLTEGPSELHPFLHQLKRSVLRVDEVRVKHGQVEVWTSVI